MINEFKKIAPYIVENVKTIATSDMSDEEVMKVIHAEIISFFEKQQNMFIQYLTFTDDQRRTFVEIMYSAIAPLAKEMQQTLNPLYVEYVERTGKTGAKNFIINA